MEIVAQPGYWITQHQLEDVEQRQFWRIVSPACSLTESDFEQWTDEQKQQWESEHPQTDPDDGIQIDA